MGELLNFPLRSQTYVYCYVLNLWDKDGFWGSVGVYMDPNKAHHDAALVMGMDQFVSFKVESVGFFPNKDV